MKNYCIVHFLPLERYPPAINFLRFMAEREGGKSVIHVITIGAESEDKLPQIPGVRLHCVAKWNPGMSRFRRLWLYVQFNWSAFFLLLSCKPDSLLYYETLSAAAPWLYKKWFGRQTGLFIHYHEYSSPKEYENGMVLSRWLHKKELGLYAKAAWVSQTNPDRVRLFLKDTGKYAPVNIHVLPNYPPAAWSTIANSIKPAKTGKIGFVYVGALSMENMYFKEMAVFVANNASACYWDIYSTNHSEEIIAFLESTGASNINFKGGILYDELPGVLPGYDIGVILYKGHIPNYIYNAPNKFFEYHVCGLNVWFPGELLGMKPYIRTEIKPWIREVNFEQLVLPSLEDGARTGQVIVSTFTDTQEYQKLYSGMIGKKQLN